MFILCTGCDQYRNSGHLFGAIPNEDIPNFGRTYGASVLHLNDDDLPNLVVSSFGNRASHYINLGHGDFNRAATGSAQPSVLDQHPSATCNYNNDGLLDTYLTAGARQGKNWGTNQLWQRLADGSFIGKAPSTTILADKIGRGVSRISKIIHRLCAVYREKLSQSIQQVRLYSIVA